MLDQNWLWVMVIAFFIGVVITVNSSEPDQPRVVDHLDVDRYVGTWYEIASIPTWFQKQCVQGTTATYSSLPNGKIKVVNKCYNKKGQHKKATGRAWIVDKTTNAKLKVSFFNILGFWLFPGDYWVIDLDSDYQYAVVGHPSKKYGWILSRTPQLSDENLNNIKGRLKDQGYDFSRFKMTDQSIHLKQEN